jgi:hypothetical protein
VALVDPALTLELSGAGATASPTVVAPLVTPLAIVVAGSVPTLPVSLVGVGWVAVVVAVVVPLVVAARTVVVWVAAVAAASLSGALLACDSEFAPSGALAPAVAQRGLPVGSPFPQTGEVPLAGVADAELLALCVLVCATVALPPVLPVVLELVPPLPAVLGTVVTVAAFVPVWLLLCVTAPLVPEPVVPPALLWVSTALLPVVPVLVLPVEPPTLVEPVCVLETVLPVLAELPVPVLPAPVPLLIELPVLASLEPLPVVAEPVLPEPLPPLPRLPVLGSLALFVASCVLLCEADVLPPLPPLRLPLFAVALAAAVAVGLAPAAAQWGLPVCSPFPQTGELPPLRLAGQPPPLGLFWLQPVGWGFGWQLLP